jgi:hypothetical protein
MYHDQPMWDGRQHPKLYEILSVVHHGRRLWVSLDRVAMKPPVAEEHRELDPSGLIRWDAEIDDHPAIPSCHQDVLALRDAEAETGGLQCVPSVYRHLDEYLRDYPTRPTPRAPELRGLGIVRVGLRAGDIAIWKSIISHSNGHNSSRRLRLAQYVTMHREPAEEAERSARRAERIASWAGNEAVPGKSFPGGARRIEQRRADPARLTELGERLPGVEPWG